MNAATTASRPPATVSADMVATVLDAPASTHASAEAGAGIPAVSRLASRADAYTALHSWRAQDWAVFTLHLPPAERDDFLHELRLLCERAARLEAYVRTRRMPGVTAQQHADQMDGRVDRVPATALAPTQKRLRPRMSPGTRCVARWA
jgi:hypothetical protein